MIYRQLVGDGLGICRRRFVGDNIGETGQHRTPKTISGEVENAGIAEAWQQLANPGFWACHWRGEPGR
ncbi:hypothetical protein N7508_006942 [Penicillium antarcticum]|uniref:uncharacterized protein n=1 Tax=Penicillium antarcticum TaxID=416450 RepID=UPI00239ABE4D|nr:uncharacterized protein N7508_006942 [Penicillium antarcticum]KAJ5302079.1 hypothetical protein N7508_006942 [Penicillium antarcticum]